MVESFLDLELEDTGATVEVDEDILALKIAYDKIFLNVYNTPEGKKMFDTLRERHVEVPIYVKGDSLEAVSYRQGMSDLVTMMEGCVDEALNPPTSQ